MKSHTVYDAEWLIESVEKCGANPQVTMLSNGDVHIGTRVDGVPGVHGLAFDPETEGRALAMVIAFIINARHPKARNPVSPSDTTGTAWWRSILRRGSGGARLR